MQKNIALNFDVLALFDAVMAEVEPDLMRKNIDTLSMKYKGETPEQKTSRSSRYAAAYAEWKKRLKQIVALWKKEVLKYRDDVIAKAKIQSEKDDETELQNLDSAIQAL
ncbi:hypothetical protein EXS65_00500 [Candidatus Peribacteria bacterium]|nr:hypothetical protein [Candidatus Peribacteria bacterium]